MKYLSLVFAVLLAQPVYGQCNVRYSAPYLTPNHFTRPVIREVVQIVHEAPIVPIVYPILVPAYQFQYSPPVVVQASPQALSQAAFTQQQIHSQPPVTQQPGNYLTNHQDKIKELAKELLNEMRKQSDQDVNGDGPPTAIGPNVPLNPVNNPNTFGYSDRNNEQITALSINALNRACAQCHTGIGSKGAVVIFNSPGVFNPSAPLKSMRREIESRRMPPQSFHYRLTADELQALRIWLPPIRE